jgi:putative membrane-bound dehydrogenase-like protein
MSGAHAPATTPALSPQDAQKNFTVPDGFEVRLFAAEPEVVNPVAMTWDERGRLWVLELYEYPRGAAKGARGRDRIKILEDTDADGRADKVTVFADGFSLATGLLLGYGGVFLGEAPNFLFLRDTNGDDMVDEKIVLKTGFGLEDRHELLNGFTWGPDGWLYMTHGVFTRSTVKDPDAPGGYGVKMDAAVSRYHPRTKKLEVFADGTSNPWGVDFDRAGNAFVSACVIDHLFHMAPGGLYVRQGGTPQYSYAYELLPSIVDHKHKMAAYSGIQIYQGDQYPNEYRGTILMGNIHDNSVHQDRLTPRGSSFKASFIKDFVRANDGWFMPVSTQVGPDGAVWIMDWYDKYPCYQNAQADPDGVDREHGRIWRVVYTGGKPGLRVTSRPEQNMNLARLGTEELVALLRHRNSWQRRVAQRLLSERRDKSAASALVKMARGNDIPETRLSALWTLHSSDQLDDSLLDSLTGDKEPAIRAWVARFSGERGDASDSVLERLQTLGRDADASVRLAVATAARQFTSGSLTINTPPRQTDVKIGKVLACVVEASADGKDPLIPFLTWTAAEPSVASNPQGALDWLLSKGTDMMPLTGQLARKTMRRICDLQEPSSLDAAIEFAVAVADKDAALASAALDGLIEGQKGKAITPAGQFSGQIAKLSSHPSKEVSSRGQQLGSLWGDAAALRKVLDKIADPAVPDSDRIKAMQSARQNKGEATRNTILGLLDDKDSDALKIAALQALSEIGGDQVGDAILKHWEKYSPPVRRAAAETLITRWQWRDPFLDEIEDKRIAPADVPVTVVRALSTSKEQHVRERVAKAIGRYRESGSDKTKLIAEKKKVVLASKPDLAAGYEVTKRTCLVCHKLHGEGADVGPDLTGVGRSTLDALLANVIDPNQIIGNGYENTEIETKDGRFLSGRVVERTDAHIKLLSSGPREDVVARSEIASMRTSDMSLMPEGLEQQPDEDFRNMIWYVLNPPQDNRPWTPDLRKELLGDANAGLTAKTAESR